MFGGFWGRSCCQEPGWKEHSIFASNLSSPFGPAKGQVRTGGTHFYPMRCNDSPEWFAGMIRSYSKWFPAIIRSLEHRVAEDSLRVAGCEVLSGYYHKIITNNSAVGECETGSDFAYYKKLGEKVQEKSLEMLQETLQGVVIRRSHKKYCRSNAEELLREVDQKSERHMNLISIFTFFF